jgi:hypothetical protein
MVFQMLLCGECVACAPWSVIVSVTLGKLICFLLQARGGRHLFCLVPQIELTSATSTLLWPLERANLNHWPGDWGSFFLRDPREQMSPSPHVTRKQVQIPNMDNDWSPETQWLWVLQTIIRTVRIKLRVSTITQWFHSSYVQIIFPLTSVTK